MAPPRSVPQRPPKHPLDAAASDLLVPSPDATSLHPVLDARRAVRALKRQDEALAKVIEHVGPCTLAPTTWSPFQALLRSIVYQQLSGKAAQTILGRVIALFPGEFPTPDDILSAPDAALRGAGLSQNKMLAVRDLAKQTLAGVVPLREALTTMSNDEIIERCTEVRGVGRWTVEMMLMFHLGRPDVLPVADLGIQKGAMRIYRLRKLPKPARLEQLARAWQPWRTVACWYLWRAVDLPADVLPPLPRTLR